MFVPCDLVNNTLYKPRAVPAFHSVPHSITQIHYIIWLRIPVLFCCFNLHLSEAFGGLTVISTFSQPLQQTQLLQWCFVFNSNVVFHATDKLRLYWPTADWNVKLNMENCSLHGLAENYLQQYYIANCLIFSHVLRQNLTPTRFPLLLRFASVRGWHEQ